MKVVTREVVLCMPFELLSVLRLDHRKCNSINNSFVQDRDWCCFCISFETESLIISQLYSFTIHVYLCLFNSNFNSELLVKVFLWYLNFFLKKKDHCCSSVDQNVRKEYVRNRSVVAVNVILYCCWQHSCGSSVLTPDVQSRRRDL